MANNQLFRILKKFNQVLEAKQKRRIGVIIVLMLIGAILETLGVSMVIPLVTTIVDEGFFETNGFAIWIAEHLHITSSLSFIILMLFGMILVFIIKDVYLLAEYYVQQRFICNNRVMLQKKVLRTILRQEYDYFLDESTGTILRTIITDVESTYALLSNLLVFFTEMIVCTVLFAAITVINPVLAVFVVTVLSAEVVIITKVFRPKMFRLGLKNKILKTEQNKWVMQAVTGIKETKVAQKERFFEHHFGTLVEGAAQCEKRCKVLENAPRLIIESVTVSAMLFYMIVLLKVGTPVNQILPELSAFAVAAFRLLPSANKLTSSYNMFAYQEVSLDAMMDNLVLIKKARAMEPLEDDEEVASGRTSQFSCGFTKVSYSYPNTSVRILDEADMDIPIGKSVGIVGRSGAGKTTAVDILLGLLKPTEGRVYFNGHDIMDDYSAWLSKLAYIPQTIFMLDDTIAANVAFGVDTKDMDEGRIWEALQEAQLSDFVKGLPDGLQTEIGERGMKLSGGQRQRIGIARALYTDPELLIFDEATSALDNETEAAIIESINALHGKKTMIIIAHRLTTIAECDMIYRVHDGKIKLEKG